MANTINKHKVTTAITAIAQMIDNGNTPKEIGNFRQLCVDQMTEDEAKAFSKGTTAVLATVEKKRVSAFYNTWKFRKLMK